MNIFLCTLSAISPENASEYHYRHNSGTEEISGYFSGEAPARYLVRELYKVRHAFFDKYIVLSTTACKKPITTSFNSGKKNSAELSLDKQETSETYLKYCITDEIKNYATPDTDLTAYLSEMDARFNFINTDSEEDTQLLTRITEDVENESSVNIYVDLSGGSRAQSIYAIMILAWLETLQFSVEKVVYANINKQTSATCEGYKQGTIDDITSTFKMIKGVIAQAKTSDQNYVGNKYEQAHVVKTIFQTDMINESVRNLKLGDLAAIYKGSEPYIFFSYAHKDAFPGQAILKNLSDHSFRIWYDVGINFGEEWEKTLLNRMDHCECALILMSYSYLNDSTYCMKEIEYLLKTKQLKSLFIINLDEIKPENIPDNFGSLREHFEKIQRIKYDAFDLKNTNQRILQTLRECAENCIKIS